MDKQEKTHIMSKNVCLYVNLFVHLVLTNQLYFIKVLHCLYLNSILKF